MSTYPQCLQCRTLAAVVLHTIYHFSTAYTDSPLVLEPAALRIAQRFPGGTPQLAGLVGTSGFGDTNLFPRARLETLYDLLGSGFG